MVKAMVHSRSYFRCLISVLGVLLVGSLPSGNSRAWQMTSCAAAQTSTSSSQEPVRWVPFHQVRMEDPIWRPRMQRLVKETLPHAFDNTKDAQERLRLCAEYLEKGEGEKPRPHRFNTSDLYKVMEGAALLIQSEPSPEIEAQMDRIIEVISHAQGKDGYLYVPHLTGSINENEMGPRPYSFLIHSHELYNVGHLYEAAVAYAQATGKETLLEIAKKNAAHMKRVIFEGDPEYNSGKPVMQAPGHQEIEIGLLKLYSYTEDRMYLEMAKRFLDIRGVTFKPDGEGVNSATYAQQHAPVAKQSEAVGHAVRATYQYAAMAEVDSQLGTDDYSWALDQIWHDIVDQKMHITGGLGAVHGIEGFGGAYELPNKDAYLETCAAVGNVFFNMRMFLKYRDARYVDVAEIALLNNCLSGVGIEGTSFFYPNPLEAVQGHQPRSGWFGTACCPSNITRLIPQVSGYMYATDGKQIYCNLYGASSGEVQLDDQLVQITQTTDYPFGGTIDFLIEPEQEAEFEIKLRIPTWVTNKLVPGGLYASNQIESSWRVFVNGDELLGEEEQGYFAVRRLWKTGDRIKLELPMPLRVNFCHERVAANRDRIAFSRGPLVYCAEGVDNEGAVQRFFVDPETALISAELDVVKEGLLQGIPTFKIAGRQVDLSNDVSAAQIKLIPYFAWSNRDRSSMITWIPMAKRLATPDLMHPDALKFASVKASHTFGNDSVDAIRVRHTPKSSFDNSIRRWTSWPERGKSQWVEIELKDEEQIQSVGVYWYDDKGGVQVPGKWHLETLHADNWEPIAIYNTDEYSTLADNFNVVHPAQDWTTRRFRIVMEPQHDETCVGILAVEVEFAEKD